MAGQPDRVSHRLNLLPVAADPTSESEVSWEEASLFFAPRGLMWNDVMEEEEKEVEQVVSVYDIIPACFKAPVVRAVAVELPEEGGGRNSILVGLLHRSIHGQEILP